MPPPRDLPRWDWARRLLRLAALLTIGAVAGWVCTRLDTPLPWMIGPLLATAALSLATGIALPSTDHIRFLGQMVVACQVGLAFSPAALAMLLDHAPAIVGTALLSAVGIVLASVLIARLSGTGLAQAFVSAVPTSPVEAAEIARRSGIDPGPVILAQVLRLSAVVLVVPFALYAIEGWPERDRAAALAAAPPRAVDLLLLTATGLVAIALARLIRLPNPNFLGPLALTAVLAVTAHAPQPFPPAVLAAAQVVLGTWLGSTFRRELLRAAGPLVGTCLLSAALVLAACAASAVAVSLLSGMELRTVVLGAAPGGVVEMALTAKFLGQNVVLITTFHLVRIFVFMPNVPWIVRLMSRRPPPRPGGDPT